jgi:ATP-binding cassette subfamily B protein
MNYSLNKSGENAKKTSVRQAVAPLFPLLKQERMALIGAFVAIIVTSVTTLLVPVMIGYTVDTAITVGNFQSVLMWSGILLVVCIVSGAARYLQTTVMGGIGRRVLFGLRNTLFTKIQALPVAFFNQNKAGDLISRVNSDTDKLNQFFSQALMQFVGNFFLILGSGIFLLALNLKLGAASLAPAAGVLIITLVVGAWVKRKNLESLQSTGGMSAEIQESLNNFKVIVAFNRVDYFRNKFDEANKKNYAASVGAGYANNLFTPVYGLASHLAQLIVLAYALLLIAQGQFTVGLLIGYLLYVNNFYMPLQQLATVWTSWQQSLAALERISEVLAMESDMPVLADTSNAAKKSVLEFHNVRFSYPGGKEVLKGNSFVLDAGKTYALVGPTGGGKTTTASLMARLYDPTEGIVYLDGKDIRSYTPEERVSKIGFILQEPFLFTGTLLDNIFYANEAYAKSSKEEREAVIKKEGLTELLAPFTEGLDTKIQANSDAISLGQRQLIAFVRAVLRKPELLILDEATANIDTVTEQLLEQVLEKLPKETTKVVIAHRLNTINNADEIFFVNGGEIKPAGSFDHAVDMLMHGKRET